MVVQRIWQALRGFAAEQRELCERMQLLDRPWEAQFLHWSGTGELAELHGTTVPPRGRRLGVTAGGWCACRAGHRRRAV
jgi:hypothetical protein